MIRGRAPLRLSFAGGGTDLSPYVDSRGGAVISATIDRYAHATLRFPTDPVISLRSLDYKLKADFALDEPLPFDGKLDLIKACIRRLRGGSETTGLDLYLETDAPPGSGLGASSALVVAVVNALATWRRMDLSRYDIARLACDIEREDVGIPGGLQDQYAAVFGGFNFIEFHGRQNVVVNQLRIDPHVLHELRYNLLLVYTGATRRSERIIEEQQHRMAADDPDATEALDRMKQLAHDVKDALLTGHLHEFGALLHEEFVEKKRTAGGITTPQIDELYDEARRLGVVGGKVSGAGGGGYMLMYCPFERKQIVSERITEMGGQVMPFAFEFEGAQTWLPETRS